MQWLKSRMQGTLRAGKKPFLKSLARDASCMIRISVDPEANPAGELHVDACVAEVRVEHATDILHRNILLMPAPAQLLDAVATASVYEVSRTRAGSEAGAGEADSSCEDMFTPLPPDVCLHLEGSQQLYFDGAALAKIQPKFLWNLRVCDFDNWHMIALLPTHLKSRSKAETCVYITSVSYVSTSMSFKWNYRTITKILPSK
jgi:hypothetical protein